MDYRKFVLGEESEPNPLYDKRTKAGRAQPKFVQTTDINHVKDSVDEILKVKERHNWGFDWNEGERKNFQDYDVVESQAQTRQEAEKLRAQNQSGWEQFGRSLSQIAVNEVALGTILGLSDLIDIMINHFSETGEDDYTNPVSSVLTDLQDQFKERMEIYRENPGQALDWHDSGWWWDNFVSVGSTASLLIPSMGITKGLGLIGKGAKILTRGTKFDRGLYKAGRWMTKTVGFERPDAVMHAIEDFTKVAIPSVISRQMEDQLEARETYNSVFDETINKLKELHQPGNEKELERFFKNNPDFVNEDGTTWDDNQIARYIADKSATYTFVNDFKYIGFDFLQFNNLLRFGSRAATRGLIKESNNVLKQMALGSEKAASEVLENSSRSAAVKDFLKFYAQNPKIAIKNIAETTAFTEGLEEMGQGITQENAKGVYERYFNPNYTDRTIASQLSDPQLWEQGFWGMAGGIVFKGVGKAGKYGWNKAKRAYYGDKLSEMDIKRMESTEESIRADEISSRLAAAQTLEAKLKLWQQGYNPQQRIFDENGNEIKTDFSDESQFEKMADDEKDLVYDNIINEYLTNMVTSAVDVGNGDLLESFIESEDFAKYIDRIAGDNEKTANLKKKMTQRFKDIKNSYYKNLRTVFGSVDIQSEYLGKAIATNMTRNEMHIKDLNEEIEILKNKILENTDLARYDNYKQQRQNAEVNKIIGQTVQELKDLKKQYNNGEINKTWYDSRVKELNKSLNEYYKIGDISKQYEEAYKNTLDQLTKDGVEDADLISKEFAKLSLTQADLLKEQEQNIGTVPDVVKDLINRQVRMEINKAWTTSQLIESQEEIEDTYNDYLAAQEDIIDNKFKYARNKVLDYITNHESPIDGYNSLMQGTAPKDIQEQFDLFKIGSDFYNGHKAMFLNAAQSEQRKTEAATEDESTEPTPEINEEGIVNDEKEETPDTEKTEENKKNTETKTVDDTTTGKTSIVATNPNESYIPVEEEVEKDTNVPEDVNLEEIEKEEAVATGVGEGGVVFDDNTSLELDLTQEVIDGLWGMTSEEKIDLREKGLNSPAYNKLLNKLVSFAKTSEYGKSLSDSEIIQKSQFVIAKTIEQLGNRTDFETRKKYLKLAQDIRNQYATTELITDETFKTPVDEIIQNYLIETKKIGQTKNGKPVINIEDLFSHLLGIYDKQLLQLVNPILQYLRYDLSNTHKYYIQDYNKIKTYLNKPNKLIQYLKDIQVSKTIYGDKESKVKYGNSIHAQMPLDAYKGLKILENLKLGDINKALIYVDDEKEVIKVIYNGYEKVNYDMRKDRIAGYLIAYENFRRAYKAYKDNPNSKIIAFQFGNSIHYRVYDGTISYAELMTKELGGTKEIAVLSTVNANENNTSFTRVRGKSSKGLFFTVTKNVNGEITSQFDKLFLDILTSQDAAPSKIYDILRNNQQTFTIDELKLIKDYFDLDNRDDIVLDNYQKGKNLTQLGANELLYDYIKNWLIDAPERLGQNDFVQSYKEYLNKMYQNYSTTYNIQSAIKEASGKGNFVVAEADMFDCDYVETLDRSETIDYSNFGSEENKIVFVDDDNLVHVVGSNVTYDNDAFYSKGSFGIILKDNLNNTGKPAITWISTKNKLSDNKELYSQFKEALKQIIEESYGDAGKTKESLTKLFKNLSDLFGNGSIVYGVDAKKVLNDIYSITHSQLHSEDELGNKFIDKYVDNVLKDAQFNFSINLAKNKNDNDNSYISVKNGKITITLPKTNGETNIIEYNSFKDFVLQSKGFNVDQTINSYTETNNAVQNSIFIESKINITSPVNGTDVIGTYNATRQLLEKTKEDTPISVRTLLETAGVDKNDIDILLGNKTGVTFINPEVYYNKNTSRGEFAEYNKETKRISLNRNLFNFSDINYIRDYYKEDLVRLLIHENIHKNFDELSEEEKKYIVKELSKVYVAFVNTLENDVNLGDEEAKNIYNTLNTGIWKDRLINTRDDIVNNKINETNEEQFVYLMNEFLAESLSQKALIKYLNSKDYNGEKVNTEKADKRKKSLWERICEIIVNFFNKFIGDVKEDSIFDVEYKLLKTIGNHKSDIAAARETKSKQKETKETKTEGRKFKSIVNSNENINENNSLYDDVELFATTSMILSADEIRLQQNDRNGYIDASDIISVSDMNEFVKMFGKDKQADFSKMLNSGAFNYACK